MIERRDCICGATIQLSSDPETVRAILMWWYQWHVGSPEHGTATPRQASAARRRTQQDLTRRGAA